MKTKALSLLPCALAVSVSLFSQAVLADSDYNIPSIPSELMAGAPAPIEPGQSGSRQRGVSRSAAQVMAEDSHLTVRPGENQFVPVASGHLNRIVTPFSDPQVTTSSEATVQIRENVVYVASQPGDDAPVTMYITQQDSERQAISLTLVPRGIAPREIFVSFDGASQVPSFGVGANRRAERWEKSQPYVETMRSLLRDVALGQTPTGYTLSDASAELLPTCYQTGLSFDFESGQMMHGSAFSVAVGVVRNTSGDQPLEINEAACGNWNVGAVAMWPRNVVAPDERTEIYVVLRHDRPMVTSDRQRPSLLNGGL